MPFPIIAGLFLLWSGILGGTTALLVSQDNAQVRASVRAASAREEEITGNSKALPTFVATALLTEQKLRTQVQTLSEKQSATSTQLKSDDSLSDQTLAVRTQVATEVSKKKSSSLSQAVTHALTEKGKSMFELVIVNDDLGVITSSPVGIACGTSCTHSFQEGTKITLTALAQNNAKFVGWLGACVGGTPTCSITLTKSLVVGAQFESNETVLTSTTTDAGNVLSIVDVALHNKESDCWIVVDDKVYSVASYLGMHPGGRSAILTQCGKDATDAFTSRGGTGKHSSNAYTTLGTFLVGALGTIPTTLQPVDPNKPYIPKVPNIVVPAPQDQSGYSPSQIAQHASESDCWIVVNKNVYSVASYIAMHPGGKSAITSVCGTDASVAFASKGGAGSHSGSAWNLLGNYLVGQASSGQQAQAPTPTPQTPQNPTSPQTPSPTKQLTLTEIATHASASDCYIVVSGKVYSVASYIAMHPGGKSVITTLCGKDATTAFTTRGGTGSHSTSAWNVLGTFLVGSVGQTVSTPPSQPVTTPPVNSGSSYNAIEVSRHASASDCWFIVNSTVYSVASYIAVHPGGRSAITSRCGTDATSAFITRGGSGKHSTSAWNLLGGFAVGSYVSGDTQVSQPSPTSPVVSSSTPTTPTPRTRRPRTRQDD